MSNGCSLGAQGGSPFSSLVGACPCVTFKSWLKRHHRIPEPTHQLVHAFPGWIHDQLVVYSVSWLFQALMSKPESRAAAEVQGPFSGKGASKEMHERVEKVFLPLLIAINSVLLEEGCKIALEIKLVASSWEAGYLSFDLFALHSAAPSKSVLKRGRGRLDDCGRHYSNATAVCLIRSSSSSGYLSSDVAEFPQQVCFRRWASPEGSISNPVCFYRPASAPGACDSAQKTL